MKALLLFALFLGFADSTFAQTEIPSLLNPGLPDVDTVPGRFSFSIYNSGSYPITCENLFVGAYISQPNLCGDVSVTNIVQTDLPKFSIDANSSKDFANVGERGEGIYRNQFKNYKGDVNYCQSTLSLSGTERCTKGCSLPLTKEKDGRCLPTCSNGAFYGQTKAGLAGCWYRVETCSSNGSYECIESYRPGPRCPAIEDETSQRCDGL